MKRSYEMSKKWLIVMRALTALVVVGLLVVGGLMIYRAGWSQGNVAGQLAAEGQDIADALYPYRGFGYMGRPFGFPSFLFGAVLFFMLLIAVGKLFRLLTWNKMMVGGPSMMTARRAGHWRRFHGHAPYGPMPPWFGGWEDQPEKAEPSEKTKPDEKTGAAEA
jgi:hypothetical protein